MLISKQQRYMVDILQRLGCARKEQLEALMREQFCPDEKTLPNGFIDTLLQQFRYCNIDLRSQDDVVFLPGKAPNDRLLEAVDVMLELSQSRPMEFWAEEKGSVLLRFSVSGKRVSLFAVLHADEIISSYTHAPPAIGSAERVVILLSGKSRLPELAVPNARFYALRQKDGTHHFFAQENI